ncbi:MAG: hypothetical protein ACYTX0_31890 [Nostoc sp.]
MKPNKTLGLSIAALGFLAQGGQQLRYSHRSNCRVNAPFIFNDSLMLAKRIKSKPSPEGGF